MNKKNLKNLELPINFYKLPELSSNFSLIPERENLSNQFYQQIIAYDLILKENFTTIMQLPRVDKIILNTSSKSYVTDKKNLISTLGALELLSGQKSQLTYARKSIANFKIRQNQILGCKVVLRKNLMYIFLDKLTKIIFPRIRDYSRKKVNLQTLTDSQNLFFVTKKNKVSSKKLLAYSLGFQNPMIFPELENHFELIDHFRGLNCTFVVLNSTPNTSLLVLSGFQLPVTNF